ncbi:MULTISPECIES: N-acetylglucosamine-6-phosphate deacetylase [Acidobacterium]|uniref:N-acetylglucosamine-6-phosphate deacetylase n=1 Tax=Acidobacterium capsulatum (strain ATCC 51196 / DSM 11244 / BCRC 80197 / JCM 7670 / NBRC 15755 / NCIMB 13165 / 161) TaxID=240015 RepID=C1F490_ACIC5|nr:MULTISPECIES: N-acetylglucosamine-6-phosphate deacetylase [Acidobacterium]ACO31696.1 N-acetylglucosamine-6-phosphate deacetylase [Acidobacterium capsulatum ATCC 51196]HCT60345.1 N-acetylglucosamine-6-phosphate deacetylase [Acidobacterium sp.]
MRTILTAARLVTPLDELPNPVVVLEDGHIVSIASRSEASLPEGEVLDFPGATLAPAYFDVHIHGSAGHDIMEATPEALATIGRFLAGHGVGAYLATTVTAEVEPTLHSLSGLARLLSGPTSDAQPGARPVGIHLEGPFLSPHKRGAHPERLLQRPSVALLDRMWQAAEGHVRLLTIAPELPGADEVIARAVELGIRVSMGHSNATLAEAQRGVQAGAVSATHTFNAMRRFDHREPGIVGEVLTNRSLHAELICDGLHVDPVAVRIFWQMKGRERGILITDAMAAAGMPDGPYKLGELDVRVENGTALIEENTLAGSTLTLDRGVRNFSSFTGEDLAQIVPLATSNPATMIGLGDQLGELAPGRRADITVLSPSGEIQQTILGGVPQIRN